VDGTADALVAAARRVRRHAYAPYSGFAVGAVLVAEDGRWYHGVNVECAAFPAGLCAERAALAAAVTDGQRGITAIAVAGPGADPVTPCGVCRQALAEFGTDVAVLCAGEEGEPVSRRLAALLPEAFGPGSLQR